MDSCKDHVQWVIGLSPGTDRFDKELASLLRSNVSETVAAGMKPKWDAWALANPTAQFPARDEIQKWIEGTLTENFTADSLNVKLEEQKQKGSDIVALNTYVLHFLTQYQRVVQSNCAPTLFHTKRMFFKGLHSKTAKIASKLSEEEVLQKNDTSLEEYMEAVQAKVTSMKGKAQLESGPDTPKNNKFGHRNKRAFTALVDARIKKAKNSDETENEQTVAHIQSKGGKGGRKEKGGNGGKGKGGKGGKASSSASDRCPVCKSPYHTSSSDCFHSAQYKGNKRPEGFVMATGDKLTSIRERNAKLSTQA